MCTCTYPTHYLNRTGQSPGRDQSLKVLCRPQAGGQSVELRCGGECGTGGGCAMTPEQPGLSGDQCRLAAGQGKTFLSDASLQPLVMPSHGSLCCCCLEHLHLSNSCTLSRGERRTSPLPLPGEPKATLSQVPTFEKVRGQSWASVRRRGTPSLPHPLFLPDVGTRQPPGDLQKWPCDSGT